MQKKTMKQKGVKPASERLYRIQKKATERRNLKHPVINESIRPLFLTAEFILMHREEEYGF